MIILRSALFALLQALLTIVFSIIALLTFPFRPMTRYRIISQWNRLVIWLAQAICGIRYEIRGLENLPATPVIVMAKHQSAWETIALPIFLPPQAIVIKRELLSIPFFGWGFRMLSPIAIDRRSGKEALRQIVAQGKARLGQGFWVLIFPEGTRVAPGEVGHYGIGGAWLATHTQTPVLPIAVNAGEVWPKNALLKRPGKVTLSIGPVMESEGLKADELNRKVRDWIEAEMERLPYAPQAH
jgi:1-acyl-sn-glycerol-3-phosphate acyltransferase